MPYGETCADAHHDRIANIQIEEMDSGEERDNEEKIGNADWLDEGKHENENKKEIESRSERLGLEIKEDSNLGIIMGMIIAMTKNSVQCQ